MSTPSGIQTCENKVIKTTCAYCGVGCGIEATVVDEASRTILVRGDQSHAANHGRLCSKGTALADTLGLSERMLFPEQRDNEGHWQQTSWDSAIETIAQGFQSALRDHGPGAIAFYVSGQLLTEDYYVANKLIKGFLGSANIDTNSRLCMASPTVAHKRAFGEDLVPGCYDDFNHADLIVLVGSNTAWCHPIIFQRIKKAKANNPKMKIVVIDPRQTDTCAIADLHLPLASGSDSYLFNGLLVNLANQGKLDFSYLEQHVEGFAAALESAKASTPNIPAVARACDLTEDQVSRFYQLFSQTDKVMTLYSQGVNQSSSGTDKCNAIINLHLATGRIGKPGMGPLSLTGQPNAMGGREVGGLANQLAAHMDFDPDSIDRVQRFWNAPNMASQAGLKAVDMFDALDRGEIKAIWIMATSPVDTLPNADKVKAALEKCPLVVVSDCVRHTDTTECATLVLPALGWGEKDGTVTNSERRISRQRALLPPPGEAKPDWWIITQVAQKMGYAADFNYKSAADIFAEHARLSTFENNDQGKVRYFSLQGLDALSPTEYDTLNPVQWPLIATDAGLTETPRLFADGLYSTPSRKARMVAVEPRAASNPLDDHFPLVLNTGRIRDQWHTMTRTSLAPQLNNHKAEPFVEVHPDDARIYDIVDGNLVEVSTHFGSMIARAEVTPTQKSGHIFVPMHWTEQLSSRGRVGALVNPAVDPLSGQPESKHTPSRIRPYQPSWYGFLLSQRALNISGLEYVVIIRGQKFYRYELAGEAAIENLPQWSRALLCDNRKDQTEWIEYSDTKRFKYRGARLIKNQLESCLFISPQLDLPARSWLAELFSKGTLDDTERMALLTGKPPKGHQDKGRTICACFGVGENSIIQSIKEKGLTSVAAIGQHLNAGTNCGSCIPELEKILASHK